MRSGRTQLQTVLAGLKLRQISLCELSALSEPHLVSETLGLSGELMSKKNY